MATKKELNLLIDSSVITEEEFSEYIERHRPRFDSYLDTLVYYCTQFNTDIASVKKLINPQILSKLTAECEQLNLITKTSTASPLFFL